MTPLQKTTYGRSGYSPTAKAVPPPFQGGLYAPFHLHVDSSLIEEGGTLMTERVNVTKL